ncbi:hypothetical protein Q5P01_023094 [Channa striata]|uniref:Uncharacterized protein n=1 Tax=Channa striata TaxID=64152 RepID=A0AA88IT72_CHASR|nr:hypothetical protein Q5P01_023094 [Channa striata]
MARRQTPTHTGTKGQAAHQGNLQSQITGMAQEIENLKREKVAACHETSTEKNKVHKLEAILEAKDREFDDERQKLNEAMEMSESKVSRLTYHLQLEQEKAKDSEQQSKEKINKLATLLDQSEVRLRRANERKWTLCKKLQESAKLLQTQEKDHKRHREHWQRTHNCLQRELTTVSEKDQILEEALDHMEKEMKKLQKKNNKLVAEQTELQKDKSTMVKDKKELEQKIAYVKEEKTKCEQENAKLRQEKTKLVEDVKNLQKKNTELAEDRKKREQYTAELEALCLKMQRKRRRPLVHRKNEVDTVAAMLEKERHKREKEEKKVKARQENEVQRRMEKERKSGFWHRTRAKQKYDGDDTEEERPGGQQQPKL